MVFYSTASVDDNDNDNTDTDNNLSPENTTSMTTTATATARSSKGGDFAGDLKSHRFSTAPMLNLKWGCQRQLRCVKLPDSPSTTASPSPFRKRRSSFSYDDDDNDDEGIEAVTEKLILDFRAKVDELQSAFLNGGKPSSAAAVAAKPAAASAAAAPESRPWKLRSDPNAHASPARNSDNGVGEEKGKRRKFSLSLSKQEIERDFVAMTGSRPAKRPKKRAKVVQKQLDALFPGFWLREITADMYKVNEEQPDAAKR